MLRFINLCEEKKYNHGNTVYAEKQPNNFVYVVQSGEFELYKSLPIQKRSLSRLSRQLSDQDISVYPNTVKMSAIINTHGACAVLTVLPSVSSVPDPKPTSMSKALKVRHLG